MTNNELTYNKSLFHMLLHKARQTKSLLESFECAAVTKNFKNFAVKEIYFFSALIIKLKNMPYSFHSHSGQFCKHGYGLLENVVKEAIRKGFYVYGLSEHMPRYAQSELYPEEIEVKAFKDNRHFVNKDLFSLIHTIFFL